MIRHMKAYDIASLEIQGFLETSGQEINPVLQLPESDLLARWSVDIGELVDILVWSPNDMARVDFEVHHCT